MSNSYFNFPPASQFLPGVTIRSAQINDLFTDLAAAFDQVDTDIAGVGPAAAAAAASAAAAAVSAGDAADDAADAQDAAADAIAAAAGVNLPLITLADAANILEVNSSGTAYQLVRSPIHNFTALSDLVIDLNSSVDPGLHPNIVSPSINPNSPNFGAPDVPQRRHAVVNIVMGMRISQRLIPLFDPPSADDDCEWRRRSTDGGATWGAWTRILEGQHNLYGLADKLLSRKNIDVFRLFDSGPGAPDALSAFVTADRALVTQTPYPQGNNWALSTFGGDVFPIPGLCERLMLSNGVGGPDSGDPTAVNMMCFLYYHGGLAGTEITQVAVPAQNVTGKELGISFRVTTNNGATWGNWKDLTRGYVDKMVLDYGLNAVVRVTGTQDLPTPVANVITLSSNMAYEICGAVDISPNRIVTGSGTALRGNGVSASILMSNTTAAQGMISGAAGASIDMMTVWAFGAGAKAVNHDLSAAADSVFSLDNCIIMSENIGTVKNADWMLVNKTIFAGPGGVATAPNTGLNIDGAGIVIVENFQAGVASPGTAIKLLGSFGGFVRIFGGLLAVPVGAKGIEVDAGATIGSECLEIETTRFAGGGSYLSGITEYDSRLVLNDNIGILNAKASGYMYQANSAVATAFAAATPIKIALVGTVAGASNTKFSHTPPNRVTYSGASIKMARISAHINVYKTGAGVTLATFYVRQNSTNLTAFQKSISINANNVVDALSLELVAPMSPGDTFELWGETDIANTTVIVQDFQFLVTEI